MKKACRRDTETPRKKQKPKTSVPSVSLWQKPPQRILFVGLTKIELQELAELAEDNVVMHGGRMRLRLALRLRATLKEAR